LKSKSHQWHRRFTAKQVVFRSTATARIYSLGGEKISFVRVMELKSVMETDRHSRNSGNESWKNNEFGLIAFHNYKISWDWYKRFTLTDDQPTKTSLDRRESRSPQGRGSSWTKSYRPADRSGIRGEKRSPARKMPIYPTDFSVAGKPWERSVWFPPMSIW
jgi:hypothetical protein